MSETKDILYEILDKLEEIRCGLIDIKTEHRHEFISVCGENQMAIAECRLCGYRPSSTQLMDNDS